MAATQRQIVGSILFLAVAFFCCIVACTAACIFNATMPIVYESWAVFQILPKCVPSKESPPEATQEFIEAGERPFGQEFFSRDVIEASIELNNLDVLDSLIDIVKGQRVDYVVQNLEVSELAESGLVYELKLRSHNPQDAATILDELVRYLQQSQFSESEESKRNFSMNPLEVARVGNQVYPVLPTNILIAVYAGLFLAAVTWFLFNPVGYKYRPRSVISFVVAVLPTIAVCAIVFSMPELFVRKSSYCAESTIEIKDIVGEDQMVSEGKHVNQISRITHQPHELLITQYCNVESALVTNNLFVMDMFIGCAKEEAVLLVQENLRVKVSDEDPDRYTIQFSFDDAEDCRKVLDAIVLSYLETLDRQSLESVELLQSMQGKDPSFSFVPIQYQADIVSPVSNATNFEPNSDPLPRLLLMALPLGILLSLTWLASRPYVPEPEADIVAELSNE